jgi:hypothetical protein
MAPAHTANLTRDTTTDRKTLSRFHQFTPGARHQTDVVFPPKRDIRGLRTPAERMSVARMVVIRRFGVSAFGEFRRSSTFTSLSVARTLSGTGFRTRAKTKSGAARAHY